MARAHHEDTQPLYEAAYRAYESGGYIEVADAVRDYLHDDAGRFYVNGDDGYPWLTHEPCGTPLTVVEAGDSLANLLDVAANHRCPDATTEDR